jgi:hypothetical protein
LPMREGRVARGMELGERGKIHPGGFQLQSVLNELQLALLFLAEKVRRTLFVEQKVGYDLFELLILVPQSTHFARFARRSAVVPASPTIQLVEHVRHAFANKTIVFDDGDCDHAAAFLNGESGQFVICLRGAPAGRAIIIWVNASPTSSKPLALLEMFLNFRARAPHRLELLAGEQGELVGSVS